MKKNTKLLALDTSTNYLTVAVMDGENAIARFHKHIGRNHSGLLMPTIDRLLKKSRLKPKDIDGFCIGIGPGSFTGLRIGVATVKGMAYSLNKPVMAVPTLDAIAGNVKDFEGVVCPVLDAKKNKVYSCLYKSDGETLKRISKYLLVTVKDLIEITAKYDKILFLGDGVPLLGKIEEGKADWYPRAEAIGRIGLKSFKKRKLIKPEDLEPMYLYSRECDITGK